MNNNTVISLDLAKSVIQIAKVSKHGEILFNKAQSPDKVRQIIANTKPCIVAMEGCGSALYWARFAEQLHIFIDPDQSITLMPITQ